MKYLLLAAALSLVAAALCYAYKPIISDMWCRSAKYFARVTGAVVRRLPFSLVVAASELALRLWPKDLRSGIALIDPFPRTRLAFAGLAGEALSLIQSNDPLRWHRVRRGISVIINVPVPGGAEYSRFLKTCRIDLRYFSRIEDRANAKLLLACRIVHQATFAHLCARRISVLPGDFARVEELCYLEERRFAKKLGLDLGEDWGLFGTEPMPISDSQKNRRAAVQVKRIWKDV